MSEKNMIINNENEMLEVEYEDRWIEYSQNPEVFGTQATEACVQKLSKSLLAADNSMSGLPQIGYNELSAYSVQESGNYGQGRICLATGILNFMYNDIAWSGNRLPVNIYHVYNTPTKGEKAVFYPSLHMPAGTTEYTGTDAVNRTVAMKLGNGWKLNYQQYLYPVSTEEYIYCDEYGSEYVFKQKEASEGEELSENLFADTAEMGYELDVKANILKRDEMFYVFDKVSCLLKEVQDSNGNSIRIDYDGKPEEAQNSAWKISKITDGIGRVFLFDYNADGMLSAITDPAGKQTKYSYDTDGRLVKVERSNGEVDGFAYNTNGALSKAGIFNTDATDIVGVNYAYGTDYKVSSVRNFPENDRMIGIDIVYETSQRVKITSPSVLDMGSDEEKVATYYSLNADGAIIGSYSKTEDGEVFVSGETQNGVIGSGGSLVMNYFVDNLISGGMVYRIRNAGTGSMEEEYSTDSIFGRSHVVRSNETSGINWVAKKQNLTPGTYTASAYVKPIGELETIEGGACIKIDGADQDYTKAGLFQSPYIRNDAQGFMRIAQTFEVPEDIGNDTEYEVRVGLYKAKGVVLVNGFQLEKGEIPSLLNILSNGGFELLSDSKLLDWQGESTAETQNITALTQATGGLTGNYCLKMTSADAEHFSASQRILLSSTANKLEHFVLSGFAKANVATLGEDERFELRAEIFYEGTTDLSIPDESYSVPFDTGVDDWQLKSVSFEKAAYRPISSIRVVLDFKGHTGEVYFDNIQLVVTDSETVGMEYFENAFEAEEAEEGTAAEPAAKTDRFGNALGSVTSEGYRGLYTSSDYGLNGNDLIAQSDERLNKTLYDVDEKTSHITAEHAPCRSSVYYEYNDGSDELKSVKTEVDGKEIKTEYTYESGDITQIKTNKTTYNIAYTATHNVSSIGISGQTPLVSYGYNASGRLKTATYPNGSVMECTYDREGRVISEVWTNGANTEGKYEYRYDHEGNLIRSVDYTRNVLYFYTYKNGKLVESRECKFTVDESSRIIREDAAVADEIREYVQTDDGIVTAENLRIAEGNDGLGRKDYREVRFGNKLLTEKYEYHEGRAEANHFERMGGAPTSNLVSRIRYSDGSTLEYDYDESGNIIAVYENGSLSERYAYDGMGRLIREDNRKAEKTVFYEYDEDGNLESKEKYGYTLGTPEDAGEKKLYRYESAWKDCLTYYSGYGETMAYTGGNPNNYHGYSLRWEKGRQLKSMTKTGSNISFEYNASGVRTRKTVNGVVHNYYLNGTNILLETIERGAEVDVLEYIYDGNGEIGGLRYNGETYVYIKNLQGDVVRMVDSTGKDVVKYVYDAWGKAEKIQGGNGLDIGSDATHIGNINPIRYRGYYYDVETELYYLQSRYYDPETCRFINADEAEFIVQSDVFTDESFVYCKNNPICFIDKSGGFAISLGFFVFAAVAAVATVVCGRALAKATINLIKALEDAIEEVKEKCRKKKKKSYKKVKHHVIAKNAARAKPARDIWRQELKQNINDTYYNIAYIYEYYHTSLHTHNYYDSINENIDEAYKKGTSERKQLRLVQDKLLEMRKTLERELGNGVHG